MKRNKNRGFILIETLIVTVFVMTIFIFIYRNSIPLVGEYEKREVYDDLDSVYAANEIKNMVVADPKFDIFVQNIDTKFYMDISNCSNYTDANYCTVLKNELGLGSKDYILIALHNLSKLKAEVTQGRIFKNDGQRGIREYLSYLPLNTSDVIGYNQYYLIISRTVTRTDGTAMQKYAYIEVVR